MDNEMKYLAVDRRSVGDPTLQAEWSAKKLVWVPEKEHGFIPGSVKQEKNDEITVELSGGKRKTFSKDDIQKMNPPKLEKVGDIIAEPALLSDENIAFHKMSNKLFNISNPSFIYVRHDGINTLGVNRTFIRESDQ
ncbi:myosin-11-like [Xenia sp. Carnegie-2017]|uniref:myosin-11-like n=1 Tax=Xenia sp. Carnegie-2017 TaxID=2897299 RepID=UPI001F04D0F0|nr:myosin-11-like [Xenia sp. Carnegie-2017]